MVDDALMEKLDAARAARQWGDVIELAGELHDRAVARRGRARRKHAGVIDLVSREPRG